MVDEINIRRGSEWQWTATGWGRAHRLALIGMVASVFAMAFVDGTDRGIHLAAFFTILSGAGLLFSRAMAPSLTDFLRGLSPRDCVLYFLLHGVVLAVPGFFGYWEWTIAVAALMGFVCFTAIDKLGFGRLHAASLVLILLACASAPLPRFEPLAAYLFFFLLCYRLEHLSQRLALFGEGRGLPVIPAVTQTLVWLLLPWAGATSLFFWLTPQMAPHTQFLTFEPGAPTAATAIALEPRGGSLIWDLAILACLVVALVFTVWWFERRLNLRRKGREAAVEERLAATSSSVRSKSQPSAVPQPDLPKDARGRILMRFKALSETLSREGWARGRGETASEYLGRVWRELRVERRSVPEGISPFHRACYSPLQIVEADAEAFVQWASSAESEIHDRAEERRQAQASRDAMP